MSAQTSFAFPGSTARPRFYLGTHMPSWLAQLDVPLFVSRRRLFEMKTLPRARGRWALDSGAFTELLKYRGWSFEARQYAGEVRRFKDEIGGMDWAAPMDWCCEQNPLGREDVVDITEHTRLSIECHQRFTVDNFLELKAIAPDLPWVPVLQGWTLHDYYRCWEMYERRGVDLRAETVVGLGTMCRRQDAYGAVRIIHELAAEGLRLHGFGFKVHGLRSLAMHARVSGAPGLVSADSLAWSYDARAPRAKPLEGCTHAKCANCTRYALAWRSKLLASLDAA